MEPNDSCQQDVGLIQRIAQGDDKAEELLCRKYRAPILLALRRKIRDQKTLEDLCHEILIALLMAARKQNIKAPEKLPAYLHGILKHKVNDWITAQRRKMNFDPIDVEPVDPSPNALEQIITDEEQKKIDQALSTLEPREKKILELRFEHEWQFKAIAGILNLNPDTARKTAERIIQKIKNQLGKDN